MQQQTLTLLALFVLLSILCADNGKLIFSFDGENGERPSQFTKNNAGSLEAMMVGTVGLLKPMTMQMEGMHSRLPKNAEYPNSTDCASN